MKVFDVILYNATYRFIRLKKIAIYQYFLIISRTTGPSPKNIKYFLCVRYKHISCENCNSKAAQNENENEELDCWNLSLILNNHEIIKISIYKRNLFIFFSFFNVVFGLRANITL